MCGTKHLFWHEENPSLLALTSMSVADGLRVGENKQDGDCRYQGMSIPPAGQQ